MKKLLKISTALFLLLPALIGSSCKDDDKGDEYPLLAAKSLVAQAGDAQVTVSWTAPASEYVKGYTVSWTPGNGSATVKDGTLYKATGLTNGTEYTFSVVAVYERGNSDAVTIKATPKADAIVYEPCTAVKAEAGNETVALSWTVPTPAGKTELSGYKISVSPADVEAIEITDAKATSQAIDNLTNGKEYTFSIVAVYKGGESSATTAKATPVAPEYVACSNLKAKAADQSIELTWTAPKPAAKTELAGYTITVTPSDAAAIKIADIATVSKTITGLTNGTEYTVTIVADYKDGGVSAGVSQKATPVAPAPPVTGFDPAEITGKAIPAGWERLGTFNDKALPASIALYSVAKLDNQTVNAYVVMWNQSATHKVYAENTPTPYQTLRGKVSGEPTVVLAGTESKKSIIVSGGQVIINREGEGAHKFKSGLSLNKDNSWSFGRMTTTDNVPYYYHDDIAQQTLWNTQEAFCSGNQYLDSKASGGIVHEAGMTDVVRSLSFVGYYHNTTKNADIAALVICQKNGDAAGMSIESVSAMLLSAGIPDGCQVALDNSVGLEINGKAIFSCSNDLYYILGLSDTSK